MQVYFRLVRFFMAIPAEFPDEFPPEIPEEVQEATGKPPGGRMSLEQKPYPCAVTCIADDYAAIESQAYHIPLAQ